MTLSKKQELLLSLTLELKQKTKEYQKLCNQFEVLKSKNIDDNAKEYEMLKQQFLNNKQEIEEITQKLSELEKLN